MAIKIAFGLALGATCYFLIGFILELRDRKSLETLMEKLNLKYEERIRIRDIQRAYGTVDNKKRNIIAVLDDAIDKTDLKTKFPFLTGEILLIFVLSVALTLGYLTLLITKEILPALVIVAAVCILSFSLLKLISRLAYDKIDNQLITTVTLMKTFSETSADVVNIIASVSSYCSYPLRAYLDRFVSQCNGGVPVDKAFDLLIDKIDSKRFRQLFTNLKIAYLNGGQYGTILELFSGIADRYMKQKDQRRKMVKAARMDISLIIVIGVLSFYMTSFLSEDMWYNIKSTSVGQMLIVYLLIVILFGVYKMIDLDKIKE